MAGIKGNRKHSDADGHLRLAPGEYGKRDNHDGEWFARPPGGKIHLGSLRNHTVTEHDDGTITVSPSILIDQGHAGKWHGYLERGIWREV